MKINFYNASKVIHIMAFLFFCNILCSGQKKNSLTNKKWDTLLANYTDGILTAPDYLDSVDILVLSDYGDPLLIDRLETYRKIIWQDNNQKWRRQQYFWFLSNNANNNNDVGKAIYYLEKRRNELGLKGFNIAISAYKFALFSKNNIRDSIISEYQNLHPIILGMPSNILKDSTGVGTTVGSLSILYGMVILYAQDNDTISLNNTVLLAHQMYNSILKRPLYKDVIPEAKVVINLIDSHSDFYKGKSEIALKRLFQINEFLKNDKRDFPSKGYYKYYIETVQSEFYLKIGDYVNSYTHIRRANEVNFGLTNDKASVENKLIITKLESEIDASSQKYKQAYSNLLRSYNLLDTLYKKQILDNVVNMYSQIQSENRQQKLFVSENEKYKRTNIFVIIIIITFLIIFFLTWIIRQNRIATAKRLQQLNNETLLQITELKGNDYMARKKMGMDLHDDVASQLANIGNLIELEALDEDNIKVQEKLYSIKSKISGVYMNVRDKSHTWYSQAVHDDSYSFTESITRISELALHQSKYKKIIEVDEHVLTKLSLAIKIEILRIVQEAMINVLKHAKADTVEIYIYDIKEGAIVLEIKDNGKGFNVSEKLGESGLGLNSIKQRVEEMGGMTEITSNSSGTSLFITVPCKYP